MGLFEVINVSHSFGDKTLYKDISFELFKGEHMGLVGQNGTGKSTLLTLLTGETIPDKGEIRRQKNIDVGYLDQHAKIDKSLSVFKYLEQAFEHLFEVEKELNDIYANLSEDSSEETLERATNYQSLLENCGFYEIESMVLKVAAGLGITVFGMDTPLGTLSGGQRAKVILAKLLLENPDVLLLDEPTNFLDKEHIDWLTDYLKGFEGAFIVVSHDFEFLDKITTCICDLEFYTLKKYSGSFSKFLEQKGFNRENYIREYAAQQRQIKKLEDYIAKNKTRASTANLAKSRQKQLDKIDRLDVPADATLTPNFHFTSLPITYQKALEVVNLEIGYYYPLLPKLNFGIDAGQKVVITGFNGIGKSTLLKTLMSLIPKISGDFQFAGSVKIGYFEQDLKWHDDLLTPIQEVLHAFPNFSEKQVRGYLAQCGINAKHSMQSLSTLSGGEQAKVKLCLLMLTKSNFLILDEVTNHLDAESKETLKKELVKWEGSIILVSHEASFYKDWADKIIAIDKI